MKRPYHVYECRGCIVTFAVEMAYEDHSDVRCPICSSDEVHDVGHGEMTESHYDEEANEG